MSESIYKCPKCSGTGTYLNDGLMAIKCTCCLGTGRITKEKYDEETTVVLLPAADVAPITSISIELKPHHDLDALVESVDQLTELVDVKAAVDVPSNKGAVEISPSVSVTAEKVVPQVRTGGNPVSTPVTEVDAVKVNKTKIEKAIKSLCGNGKTLQD
jgi:hypothetical protein